MNVCLIIPTGIGAEIGGHAGDANPVAKLMGAVADQVILHPNVVNGSDINEMPENALYVEGSMLNRWLQGEFRLRKPLQNRILVVTNGPIKNDTINAVSAADVTVGTDTRIMALDTPLQMIAEFENGRATGRVIGWEALLNQVNKVRDSWDALAIHTPIECDRQVALDYFKNGGVNPWGGVEAKASKLIAAGLDKPVAHAPQETVTPDDPELWNIIYQQVDHRMAPEVISSTYLHCVLKGLNQAPRISESVGLHVDELDAVVTVWGSPGPGVMAAQQRGIPVIVVRENQTINDTELVNQIEVENYWEAAGLLMCMNAGITPWSVRK